MKDEDKTIPMTLAELRAVARKCFCVDCKKLATQEAYDERKTFDLCDEHGEEWAEECEVSEKETARTIRAVQARIDGLSAKAERWGVAFPDGQMLDVPFDTQTEAESHALLVSGPSARGLKAVRL